MKSAHVLVVATGLALASLLILQQSCKKDDVAVEPIGMTVNLPRSDFRNETYYLLDYRERSVELDFSHPVDSATVPGNISFSHKGGALEMNYKTISSGRKVIIAFREDFQLHAGS